MSFLLPAAAIGAGLGGLKTFIEAGQAADERKRQAAMTRYSPWTGMTGHTVSDPSLIGNVLAGGGAGLAQGQSIDKFNADQIANPMEQHDYAGPVPASAPQPPTPPSFSGMPAKSPYTLMGSAGALGGARPAMTPQNPWWLMQDPQAMSGY